MKTLLVRIVRALSSLWLSCILLLLAGLLTWLGTLAQVEKGLYEVQKEYFESFFLFHEVGPLRIPLPGANLVLSLLFVNLVLGGILRMSKSWSKLGVLVAHAGIAFLLLSGFIKLYHSEDGHVTLYPNERANYFQSYYRWELVIAREAGDGRIEELVVPQELFDDARGPQPVTLTSSRLPFVLEVSHFMPNSRVMPKGPMFDVAVPVVEGVFLDSEGLFTQAEANVPGAYVTVIAGDERRTGMVWGYERHPWTVETGAGRWAIGLRKERYEMPFTLVLDEFTKEDHPRIDMPRVFASDVTVIEGDASRTVRISMNKPLRDGGLVLYQSSWGPRDARPGEPLFSTFSVVRNPADQYPLYACIVIGVGLVLHFTRVLVRYIRSEASIQS